MIVDITEEEREFLERLCTRAQIFAMKGLGQRPGENDVESIKRLIKKLRKEPTVEYGGILRCNTSDGRNVNMADELNRLHRESNDH